MYTNALVDVHRSGCYSWRKLHESGRLVLAYNWMLCVAYNLESNKGEITMTENEKDVQIKQVYNTYLSDWEDIEPWICEDCWKGARENERD